jgi:hypothetical protein
MRHLLVTRTVLGLCAIATGVASEAGRDTTTLAQVLDRLGQYVDRYGERMAVVVGMERYTQRDSGSRNTRELVSEIALLQVRGDWVGYRDVFQANGIAIPDRQSRLRRLFEQSPSSAVEEGRRIADESARYNLGRIIRNFNIPTAALFFLQTANLQRFRFAFARTSGEAP